MAGTTSLGFPYPELTDDPNGAAQIQALAEAVDAKLVAPPAWPVGDSSHSMYLTGSDIAFTANDNKNILTTGAITLARDQWVLLSGKVRATNAGGNIGFMGCYIDVDATIYPQLSSGVLGLGTTSPTDRRELVIPAFTVFCAAGSHTFRLRGDRDNAVTTINVQASDALNNTYHPTSLTVIV